MCQVNALSTDVAAGEALWAGRNDSQPEALARQCMVFAATSVSSFNLRGPYAASVVDDQSPEPLYRQVAGILRERIASGDITSRLPSLKTITQEYGVSHVTAEKAVALLREEGLVVVVIGRGAFVAMDRG